MKLRYKLFCVFGFVLVAGFFIPDTRTNPVSGATLNDWHQNSFWYEPWGSSGVHKGIDIFATKGTELVSSTPGIVLYQGHLTKGGQVILVLGPKWRLHYYAHLNSINVDKFEWVSSNQKIGTVGDSGNAKGKPSHLHYSIVTMVPYLWQASADSQGWKKMFFLDPGKNITGAR
ncbi:MAG: M23 family metallopeptidase [Gammaproteobacteria bacterium]|nr:M23 family metallopeptidase [Gammaproteobacteria bacterium]